MCTLGIVNLYLAIKMLQISNVLTNFDHGISQRETINKLEVQNGEKEILDAVCFGFRTWSTVLLLYRC